MEVKKIRNKHILILCLSIIILMCVASVSASQDTNQTLDEFEDNVITTNNDYNLTGQDSISSNLETRINNAQEGEEILIEPGTYKIHNIKLEKSIILQGHGNPQDIIIDGEEKSSIFLIRNSSVHVTFKNITFINGLTHDFGGAISNEKGHMTVDNCIFINNTALSNTNAGGISNYGVKKERGYLYITNSIFINNHADHDGGAITTCYADSYIYNCVFINNSAHRDGGAIRVSVSGYGDVQDCIFMYNHADEWGGAYYSWAGESNINRCIFMNNTAGTNGGAVMVSGNLNLENSIIVNNYAGETGGSFYIQQPMYNQKTTINVRNNLITNNSSPYGQEIFINWKDTNNLYPQFNDNDWGDEDPNDPSVNDPNNVTSRIKVSSIVKSNLFSQLNVDLLDKHADLLKDFFTNESLDNLKNQFKKEENNVQNNNSENYQKHTSDEKTSKHKNLNVESNASQDNAKSDINSEAIIYESINNPIIVGNSTAYGDNDKAYELNETQHSVAKQASFDIRKIIIAIAIVFILLAIGYKRFKKEE